MIIPTHEEMLSVNTKSIEIKNRINDIVLAGNVKIEDLEVILRQEETRRLAGMNQDIYLICLISEIYREEKRQGEEKSIFDNRNIDEAIRVYRILSLYLRRIEFDFPMEQKSEIINYILNEKLSITAVFVVIMSNMAIIQKEKVINGFKEILSNFSNN